MMKQAAQFLDWLSSILNTIALSGAVLSVVLMVLAALWQAVARYILASPPVWTEELACNAMIWCGMLGASCSFRAKVDPVLSPASLHMKGRLGVIWALVRSAGTVLFIFPVLYYSLFGPGGNLARGYIVRLMSRDTHTLGISMAFFGIAIPIAFLLILIHLMADIAGRLSDIVPPGEKTSEVSTL